MVRQMSQGGNFTGVIFDFYFTIVSIVLHGNITLNIYLLKGFQNDNCLRQKTF